MHGTQKLGIQPLPERGGQGGVSGDTHLGHREKQGQGSTWCSCPKQGMPRRADRAATSPPKSFPPAFPEQTLQLARKQRFLMMGNVRAAEPVVLLPRSPAGILGKHSRAAQAAALWPAGRDQRWNSLPIPSTCPLLRLSSLPPGGGDRRHRGGRSPGLLLV